MNEHYLATLVVLLAMTALVAGCNNEGVGGPTEGSMSFMTSATTTPDTTVTTTLDGGEEIALVHNPEPASMLLMGIGLAGAALRRRRKK